MGDISKILTVKFMEDIHWYALKVFYNRVSILHNNFIKAEFETYYAMKVVESNERGGKRYSYKPIVGSLFFAHCMRSNPIKHKKSRNSYFMYHLRASSNLPIETPDSEMNLFIAVTSIKDTGLDYIGEDTPKYHVRERVRAIDGIYKGTKGIIKKINKNHRLIVTLSGIPTFATSFIHSSFLQKI